MKFFFEKWKEEKKLDISSCLFASSFSTRFTANGVPFKGVYNYYCPSIHIYKEPELTEVAAIPTQPIPLSKIKQVNNLIINYFENSDTLNELILNEQLKIARRIMK